jgi:hypothetical protein
MWPDLIQKCVTRVTPIRPASSGGRAIVTADGRYFAVCDSAHAPPRIAADGFVETFQPFWFQEIGRTKMDWERRSAGRMGPMQRLGLGGQITPDLKERHS